MTCTFSPPLLRDNRFDRVAPERYASDTSLVRLSASARALVRVRRRGADRLDRDHLPGVRLRRGIRGRTPRACHGGGQSCFHSGRAPSGNRRLALRCEDRRDGSGLISPPSRSMAVRLSSQYSVKLSCLGVQSPLFSCALVSAHRYTRATGERLRRAIAQLAEHRSPKPKVGGSSPSCPAAEGSKLAQGRS